MTSTSGAIYVQTTGTTIDSSSALQGNNTGAGIRASGADKGRHGREQRRDGGDQGKGQQNQYVNERLATVSTA